MQRIKLRQKRLEHELRLEHEIFAATVERDKEKQIRMAVSYTHLDVYKRQKYPIVAHSFEEPFKSLVPVAVLILGTFSLMTS